jgi:hypothetical protein
MTIKDSWTGKAVRDVRLGPQPAGMGGQAVVDGELKYMFSCSELTGLPGLCSRESNSCRTSRGLGPASVIGWEE